VDIYLPDYKYTDGFDVGEVFVGARAYPEVAAVAIERCTARSGSSPWMRTASPFAG
jgi:uncharacterized Fe-S radical SAM superfamily protein PflX